MCKWIEIVTRNVKNAEIVIEWIKKASGRQINHIENKSFLNLYINFYGFNILGKFVLFFVNKKSAQNK